MHCSKKGLRKIKENRKAKWYMQKRKRRGREIQKSENKEKIPNHCVEFRKSAMRIAREFLLKTTLKRGGIWHSRLLFSPY